jgi:hypothetical protein
MIYDLLFPQLRDHFRKLIVLTALSLPYKIAIAYRSDIVPRAPHNQERRIRHVHWRTNKVSGTRRLTH